MQEIVWYAVTRGVTRPVPGADVPLWFSVLLFLGLVWAGTLIGSGALAWYRSLYKKA